MPGRRKLRNFNLSDKDMGVLEQVMEDEGCDNKTEALRWYLRQYDKNKETSQAISINTLIILSLFPFVSVIFARVFQDPYLFGLGLLSMVLPYKVYRLR